MRNDTRSEPAERPARSRRRVSWLALVIAAVTAWGATAVVPAQEGEQPPLFDGEQWSGLGYRLVGPFRGGRVTAVAGVVQEPHTFYMGSTGGGVWKTENAGTSWHNVTDGFLDVGSIGAVAVAPSDPNVVYVGTGSACPRGNISIGKGVWGSTDAGRTWSFLGLPDAGLIGRIAVHPTNPRRAWVAVLGQIFGPDEERGVYRTDDGGQTWVPVLQVSPQTGAVDLSLDPTNPRILFATMWRAERKPWTLIDGGEESGLWRSLDGGDTWEELTTGLPTGELGRIGVSVSPADPKRVFALVSAPEHDGGLFRSDDRGDTWTRVSDDRELQTRGWYYSHVLADPADPDTVWVMNVRFWKSIDGGRTFERVDTPHGDNHDLWIHPHQPDIMVEGNDGGANVSLDAGESWSTLFNQPTAEFYRVSVDERFDYRVYGAQQDNSTISVPSRPPGGITPQQHWYAVAGAESGHIAVHPENPDLIYSGNYLGQIDRYDHESGHARNVILYPQMQDGTAPRDLAYRFQWNAPIRISRWDHDVVYHASNFVHRTRNGGMDWETISPDLTRNDSEKQELPGGPIQHDHTGVEVYNTVFALAESPLVPGVLWAGADDGLVHVTRDGGQTWEEVTPPGMPLDATVNTIEPSHHVEGRVYVAAYRYRNDDWAPYVFATDDGGQTWRRIADGTNGIPEDWPVRVVREDPEREGLLYAGTEFGMFVSFDDGQTWQSFQLDLPRTPITDLQVHRQQLVVATQGRSFWILDDLTPLHQLTDQVASGGLYLFEPRTAWLRASSGFSLGGEEAAPPPAPSGAQLWLRLPAVSGAADEGDAEAADVAVHPNTVRLEIFDDQDRLLRRFSTEPEELVGRRRGRVPEEKLAVVPGPEAGYHRFLWDLRVPGPDLVEGSFMSLAYTGGATVPPGRYRIRLTLGSDEDESGPVVSEQTLEVRPDPDVPGVTADGLERRFEFGLEIAARLTRIHDVVWTLRELRRQLEEYGERAAMLETGGLDGESRARFDEARTEIDTEIDALEEELIQHRHRAGQDPINFPPRIDDQYAYLYSHVVTEYGAPTGGAQRRLADLDAELAPSMERYRRLVDERVPALDALLDELGLTGLTSLAAPGE